MNRLLVTLVVFFLTGGVVWAAGPQGVQWIQNIEPDMASYRVYETGVPGLYGTTPLKECPVPCDSYIFPLGHEVGDFWAVVTAVDTSGNESGPSNEVPYTFTDETPPAPPAGCAVIP